MSDTPEVPVPDLTEGALQATKKAQPRLDRPYPRRTLEQALRVPLTIKENNGGNAWASGEVATSIGMGKTGAFFYITAASRDFGLTEGTRDTATIQLTDLGRRAVYPENPESERASLYEALFSHRDFQEDY
jgi:hypothetical protein